MAKTVMYQGKEWTIYKLALANDITPQTLARRISLGMSVEEAIEYRGMRDVNADVYDIYSRSTGEKLHENVVGVMGISKIMKRSQKRLTKKILEEGIGDYIFIKTSQCTLAEHWNRTCRKLKESGADLSRIRIVGKD